MMTLRDRLLVFLAIAIVSLGIATYLTRFTIDFSLSANARSISLLSDQYKRVLRNSRWPIERFEYYKATDGALSQKELETVEAMLLHMAFGFENEYFLLRSLGGKTEIEIRRGGLNKVTSNFKFLDPNFRVENAYKETVVGCEINDVAYLCVVEPSVKREFVSAENRVYTAIAIGLRDSMAWLEYPIFRAGYFIPTVFSELITNTAVQREGFWGRYQKIGDGLYLKSEVSISDAALFYVFICFVVLSFGCLLVAIYLKINKAKSFKNQRAAILKSKLESFQEVQTLIKTTIHDINSPIGALRSLEISEQNNDRKQLLAQIRMRFSSIIRDLEKKRYSYSCPHTNEFCLEYFFEGLIEEKRQEHSGVFNISVDYDFSGHWVAGSQSMFFRVVSNLVNNAIESYKLSGQKNGIVKISAARIPGNFLEISIQDSGAGIPEEVLPNLFVKNFTYGKTNGSGLGLWSAKQYVESVGGKIELSSVLRQGTTVRIQLPIVSAPSWHYSCLDLKKIKNIFVVDDELEVFNRWKNILSPAYSGSITYLKHPSEIECEYINRAETLFFLDNNFDTELGLGLKTIDDKKIRNVVLVTGDWFLPEVQAEVVNFGVKLLGKDHMNRIEVML